MWWKEPIRNNNPISQEIPKILGVLCQEPRTKTKYISYCTTPPDRNKPQTRQYTWNNSFQDIGSGKKKKKEKDGDSWEVENTWSESYDSSITAWREFPGPGSGRKDSGGAQQSLYVEETKWGIQGVQGS